MKFSEVKTYVSGVLNAMFPNRKVLSRLSDSNGILTYNDVPLKQFNYRTGDTILYVGTSVPKDWVLCDGSELDITSYRNLSTYIARQFGSVNHFGGDGTTTFAVPDYSSFMVNGFKILIKK